MTTDGGDGKLPAIAPPVVDLPRIIHASYCSDDSVKTLLTNIQCLPIVIEHAEITRGGDNFILTLRNYPLTIDRGEVDSLMFRFIPGPPPQTIPGKLRITGYMETTAGKTPFDTTFSFEGRSILDTEGLRASLEQLAFGTVTNCDPRDTTIYLTNLSCDTLWISGSFIPEGITLHDVTFPITLLPGEGIDITLDYRPKATNVITTPILFYTHQGTQYDTLSIEFSANGVLQSPEISITHDTINFGTTSFCYAVDTLIRIMNSGCDTVWLDIERLDYSPFTVPIQSLPIALSVNHYLERIITFSPASEGEFKRTVRFISSRYGRKQYTDLLLT
ncbi:MAG: hypothetical protein ACRD4B_09450, partial [Acidobacteriota bacterium]